MTDSEFDDEFRKKLEDVHYEFDQDSWAVLEENLNSRAVRRRRMVRTGIALFTALLLLFISGTLYLNNTKKSQKNIGAQAISAKTDKEAITDGISRNSDASGPNGVSENSTTVNHTSATGNSANADSTGASGNAANSEKAGHSTHAPASGKNSASKNLTNSATPTGINGSDKGSASGRSVSSNLAELKRGNTVHSAASGAGNIGSGSNVPQSASGSEAGGSASSLNLRGASTKSLIHASKARIRSQSKTFARSSQAGEGGIDAEESNPEGSNVERKGNTTKPARASKNASSSNGLADQASSAGSPEGSSDQDTKELNGLQTLKPLLVYNQKNPIALQINPVPGSDAFSLSKANAKQKKEKVVRPSYPKNWLLSLSAAPEDNSVSFNPVKGQLGLSLGAALGYNFSPRWTVWLGAAYSIKLYNSSWKFRDSASNLQNGSVDANCKVLEIPVYMHYNLYNGERSNVYLGAGVSTYFLLKEDYKFYSATTPSTVLYTQTVQGKNKNLLNVVQVMAGYQLKFSNSVAIGVQPFIKIPLTGVGQHKYTDISTGASLILNFKLNNRN